jgi:predicted aspartyl protease
MGRIYGEFTLKNAGDIIMMERGHLKEADIRTMVIRAQVDTGADAFFITEAQQKALHLPERRTELVRVAGGEKKLVKVLGPVEVWWGDAGDRVATMDVRILPGQNEALVGVQTLEQLRLFVDPKNERLLAPEGDDSLFTVW